MEKHPFTHTHTNGTHLKTLFLKFQKGHCIFECIERKNHNFSELKWKMPGFSIYTHAYMQRQTLISSLWLRKETVTPAHICQKEFEI